MFTCIKCVQLQGDHYSQLLDNEHRIVSSLKASLHAKEKELTQAMDKFLQEKLASAKAHGELSAMGARLERAQQDIQALQRKVEYHVHVLSREESVCMQGHYALLGMYITACTSYDLLYTESGIGLVCR